MPRDVTVDRARGLFKGAIHAQSTSACADGNSGSRKKTQSRAQGKSAPSNPDPPKIDFRKQLFNKGLVGKVEAIQLPVDRITQLNGILFDLDPGEYGGTAILPKVPRDPVKFYDQVVKVWLKRHPVLNKAEVRKTGTGLHAVLWLDSPVVFETAEAHALGRDRSSRPGRLAH